MGSIEHQLNDHLLNLESVTVIMAEIAKLIQVLTVNHKEQMEQQARCHQEQINKQDRHHKENMDEQARQSREQEKKHVEQMAVLIDQVKVRDAEMKHLIGAARDGTKGSSTPAANFEPFDSNSELWLDYLERFRTFLTANSIPRETSSSVSDQSNYSNLKVT